MKIFYTIQDFLQFSLIYNPSLLSAEFGLTLLDPETFSKITKKPLGALSWNEFVKMDDDAQKLFQSNGFRLGILAESIFETWLIDQEINYKRGLQIFEKEPVRKTLGELDFLYYKNQSWNHVELAAKIYCFRPEFNDYIGPNKRDFFHRKLQSLQNKQLPLISDPSTIRILKNQGLDNITESQVHFCGRLFYPPGHWDIPNYVNPQHPKGIYYETHFPVKNYRDNQCLMLLPRYLWFLPQITLTQLMPLKFSTNKFAQTQWADMSRKTDIQKLESVLRYYKNLGQTTMLAALEKKAEKWTEIHRILLLPHSMN